MKLSKKHKAEIKKIMQEMNCHKDFECYKSGFSNRKGKTVGELVECPEEDPQCSFAMPFGYGYFCQCPLNIYVHHNLIL